jgi:hypothetical protein
VPKRSNARLNLSKNILAHTSSLSKYKSGKPLTKHMIKLVQDVYNTRYTTNIKTANIALNLLTAITYLNKFKPNFTHITKLITKQPERANVKQPSNAHNQIYQLIY